MTSSKSSTAKQLARLANRSKESIPRTLGLALALAVISGLVVSTTKVWLEPIQLDNQQKAQRANLLKIAEQHPGIDAVFTKIGAENVKVQMVNLQTGVAVAATDPLPAESPAASRDPDHSIAIPRELDVAGIKRRPKFVAVYTVEQKNRQNMIILPIYGKGYASTLRGFIGLAADANTIVAISFYQHEETPGIGARIDDPKWLAKWQGKKIRGPSGNVRIQLTSQMSSDQSSSKIYQVDRLTGATHTSRGVENLVRYWLGDHGFGPYLKSLGAASERPHE